jgi:hypothetical protein
MDEQIPHGSRAAQAKLRPDPDTRPKLLELLGRLLRTKAFVGIALLFLVGIGLILLSFYALPDPDDSVATFLVRDLGAGLMVGAVVALVLDLLVHKYEDQFGETLTSFIRSDVTRDLGRIKEGIAGQAKSLYEASASLEALHECGFARVYEGRGEIAQDLVAELSRSDISGVRLMGVSLNDFVRSDQADGLHGAWEVLAAYVWGKQKVSGSLDIKVLVVDPNCFGAQLRQFGETEEEDVPLAGRLESDLKATAAHLVELVNAARDGHASTGVSFDFRLYHLPPTLFVCKTDRACYVQPYYYWSRRDPKASLPLAKLAENSTLQDGIENHFRVIWEHGSTDGCEWFAGSHVGTDKGIHETGVVNVFSDAGSARRRMLWMLQNAKAEVDVQGISLHSFFSRGELFKTLQELVKREGMRIRVLVLDPECDQAQQRSFREAALAQPGGDPPSLYADYSKAPTLHRRSDLYRDTWDSMTRIDPRGKASRQLEAKVYDSASSCFMLRVDDHVFVEQYHLGKVVPADDRELGVVTTLGKDMPLIEFRRNVRRLFETPDLELRSPFRLLEDHFEFVFGHLSRPLEDYLRDVHERPDGSDPLAA